MERETACATGSAAIRVGYTAIKSGLACVILASEEKVKEMGTEEKVWILAQGVGTGRYQLT